MNEIWQVIFLGIVEGLTEFIPVSSTGHLILVSDLMNFSMDNKESFSIFIQLGAILSVLVLYRDRFYKLLRESLSLNFNSFSVVHLVVGCLPAFIFGALLHDFIKQELFSSKVVAITLILGGIVFLFIEKQIASSKTTDLDQLTIKQAILIGLWQCLALCPGVSRSGATIVGGLLTGLDKKTSADFSFILAVPVMFVAVLYDSYKILPNLTMSELNLFGIGFVVAFITALLAIKVFLSLLRKYSLVPFGVYRIIMGVIILGTIYYGGS